MVCPLFFPTAAKRFNFCNDGWVQEFAIISWTWQILYFQECNNDFIKYSTKRAWKRTRESMCSVANGAADNTTVKNIIFTKAREASEASRIYQFSSFVKGANLKPHILIKSQQVGTWGNFKDSQPLPSSAVRC